MSNKLDVQQSYDNYINTEIHLDSKVNIWLPVFIEFWISGYVGISEDYHGSTSHTLREESRQNNVILQYKLLASSLSAICSVIQQS